MSLNELTQQVKELPSPELHKFSEWFDVYREAARLSGDPADARQAQQNELFLRQAEYQADPALASAWDDGFFDRLRHSLRNARAQKA